MKKITVLFFSAMFIIFASTVIAEMPISLSLPSVGAQSVPVATPPISQPAQPFTVSSIQVVNDATGEIQYKVWSYDHPFEGYPGAVNISTGELGPGESWISNFPFNIGRCFITWTIPGNFNRESVSYITETFFVDEGQRAVVSSRGKLELINITKL